MRTLILFSFSVIVLFVVFFVVNYLIKQKSINRQNIICKQRILI